MFVLWLVRSFSYFHALWGGGEYMFIWKDICKHMLIWKCSEIPHLTWSSQVTNVLSGFPGIVVRHDLLWWDIRLHSLAWIGLSTKVKVILTLNLPPGHSRSRPCLTICFSAHREAMFFTPFNFSKALITTWTLDVQHFWLPMNADSHWLHLCLKRLHQLPWPVLHRTGFHSLRVQVFIIRQISGLNQCLWHSKSATLLKQSNPSL